MATRSAKHLIFMTIFIDLLGFGIIIPILPAISAQYLPGDMKGMGAAILMTAFSLLQMLFSPFWGRMSDRYGRRPILLVSLAGSTLSYLLFAVSRSFELLLISRVLAGLCGANITAAQAYIADITSEKDRTAGMGLVGMAFGLGFAFGPVIGGGATHAWEVLLPGNVHVHTGAGLAAAAICGLNLIGAWFRLPESLPAERRGKVHFKRFASAREALTTLAHPVIGPLILLYFLLIFAFANIEVSFSLWAKEVLGLNLRWIYGLFVVIGLEMAFVQGYAVRKLVRRVGEPWLVLGGTAILTISLLAFPWFPNKLAVLLPLTLMAVGQGMSNPSVMSLISRNARADKQGNVLGTSQSAASLARIVGPLFGGILFDQGASWPFLAAAAVMGCAAIWAFLMRGRLFRAAAFAPAGEAPAAG